MIQKEDNELIEHLKKDLGIRKKIEVIRAGLKLLEKDAERLKRIKRWEHATKLVVKYGDEPRINKEFQTHSRMKKI